MGRRLNIPVRTARAREAGPRPWLGRLLALLPALVAGCDPPPLTPSGVIAAFGAQGMAQGAFVTPRAIAVGPDGSVYVADKTARIQRFSPQGEYEAQWSMPERAAGKPVGVFVSPDQRVFVADTHYSRIMVYDRDGNELARFGEHGTGDGQFLLTTDVAMDADGYLYVSEYGGNDRISKWTPDYRFVCVLVAGEVAGRSLARPSALDIDAQQTLWVADSCNHRLLRFDLSGRLIAHFGEMGDGAGQMRFPYDVSATPDGNVLVCEYANSRLQWFSPDGRSLRTWGAQGRELGQLWAPWGAAIGPEGNVFVIDTLNCRVQVIRP